MLDNEDMPKPYGIDKSGGASNGQDRLTPFGISNDPTEDVLRTAGTLSAGSVTQGITPESLAKETMAALDQSKGYQDETASIGDSFKSDGNPLVLNDSNEPDSMMAPSLHNAESSVGGFLKRQTLLNQR